MERRISCIWKPANLHPILQRCMLNISSGLLKKAESNISDVRAGHIAEHTTTVCWLPGFPITSQVKFGLDAKNAGISEIGMVWVNGLYVLLTDPCLNTSWYYLILSRSSLVELFVSGDYSFDTKKV